MSEVLLEEAKKDIESLNDLSEKHRELLKQQEEILVNLYQELTPLIKIIKESGYKFSHPTLLWHSSRGPILGYDKENRELYLFAYGDGIIKYNTVTKDERHVFFSQIVQLDMFKTAYEGIKYVEEMLKVYKKELAEEVKKLEQSLIGK